MNTLEILRQINILSSLTAVIVSGYLLYRIHLRYRNTEGIQKRITGAALLGVAGLFFINSSLLLTTFIAIAVAYNVDFINVFSNVRVLFINTITVAISIVILLIERGRI